MHAQYRAQDIEDCTFKVKLKFRREKLGGLEATPEADIFELGRNNYPRFVARSPARAFCVPMQRQRDLSMQLGSLLRVELRGPTLGQLIMHDFANAERHIGDAGEHIQDRKLRDIAQRMGNSSRAAGPPQAPSSISCQR
jgi:hypothetical protein